MAEAADISASHPAVDDLRAREYPRLMLILGTLTVIGPFGIDMYLPALPRIAADLRTDVGHVQYTLSFYLLGIALGQAVIGPLVDRWGRRRPLLGGLGLYVAAAVGCATASSIVALIACRFAMALGASVCMVVPRAIVRDRFGERDSARMYSLLMLIMGVSPILAPSLGGQLMGLIGWRGIFWTLVLLGGAGFAIVATALRDLVGLPAPLRGGFTGAMRTYGQLLADPRFIGPALVAGSIAGAVFAYLAASAFVLIQLHGLSEREYAVAFGVIGAGLIAASQINRRLVARHPPRRVAALALGANAVIGLALVAVGVTGWGGLPLLFALFFLYLSAAGFISPNLAAIVMAPFGATPGSASALLGTLQFGVGSLGGALVSLWHNGTAVPMTLVIAVCGIAAAAAWHMLVRGR